MYVPGSGSSQSAAVTPWVASVGQYDETDPGGSLMADLTPGSKNKYVYFTLGCTNISGHVTVTPSSWKVLVRPGSSYAHSATMKGFSKSDITGRGTDTSMYNGKLYNEYGESCGSGYWYLSSTALVVGNKTVYYN